VHRDILSSGSSVPGVYEPLGRALQQVLADFMSLARRFV
jgi:hypothetical protein